jgi:hypothetical protein
MTTYSRLITTLRRPFRLRRLRCATQCLGACVTSSVSMVRFRLKLRFCSQNIARSPKTRKTLRSCWTQAVCSLRSRLTSRSRGRVMLRSTALQAQSGTPCARCTASLFRGAHRVNCGNAILILLGMFSPSTLSRLTHPSPSPLFLVITINFNVLSVTHSTTYHMSAK